MKRQRHEMFSNAISTSQTNYWRQKLTRNGVVGYKTGYGPTGLNLKVGPLEWVTTLTHRLTNEKTESKMEGTGKTDKDYGAGLEYERDLQLEV